MSRLVICLAGTVFMLVRPISVSANIVVLSPAQQKEAAECVEKLGSDTFSVREEASTKLFTLGLAAKPFLLEGAQNADLEIRRRCQELLPAVMQADLQSRIDAFLADKEGKKDHDLPGWKRFRKVAGDDAGARVLFAEVQRSEAARFLADCDARPDAAGELLHGRAQLLQQRLYNPQSGLPQVSVPDVATLLFVGTDERVRVPLQAIYVLNSFFYQPAIRSAVTATGASPFKRLLIAWMNCQTDPNVIQQILYLAMNLEMKEALGMALKVAQDKTVKGHPLGLALTTVGKLGGKEHLKLFESHLDDASVIGNFQFNQIRGTTEVRDVALAMMVQITGQDHKDYGFAFVQMANMSLKFNPFYQGFATPQQRTAAFKKWAAHVAIDKKRK